MDNKTKSEKQTNAPPKITRKRVRQELKRVREGIAHDLEEYKVKYPPPDGKTLSRVMD